MVKLLLGEELRDERRQEICNGVRILNQLPKLSKITVDRYDDYDISQVVVEGLCERRKWIHQLSDYVKAFRLLSGLTHLEMGGLHTYCNVTDETLKAILEKNYQSASEVVKDYSYPPSSCQKPL